MAFCSNCGTKLEDGATFCSNCGASANPQQAVPVIVPDPYDHTGEFAAEEVAEYKTFALVAYLFGVIGIIISLLAVHNDSKYINFHVRQVLKTSIIEIILAIVFIIPIIGTIIGGIAFICMFVFKIISFVWTCQNKSKEVILVRKLSFLG